MTLFTSLYTGVSGMNAQSQATASISTNIANMTTTGYKRSDTAFHDLVVNNTKPARFANGGVLASQVQRIDSQGALQQTGIKTEMGIVGDGFFIVKANDDPSLNFLYTRNGTFSPDADGVLRNAAGFIVYGWPVDSTGNVAASTSLQSLVPVDVNELDSQSIPTTVATMAGNLDASEEGINRQIFGLPILPVSEQSIWDSVSGTVTDNSEAVQFSRDLTVYDGSGTARNLTFEFRKITGPMAFATSQTAGLSYTDSLTDPVLFPSLTAGDTFTISAGAATQDYIIGAPAGAGQVRVDTVGDLTNHLNSSFGGGSAIDAGLDSGGRLLLKAVDPTVNLVFAGTPITGAGTFDFPATSFTPVTIVTTADPAINPQQDDFPPFADLTSPNTNGWWEVRVLKPADPSLPYTDPLYGQKVEISKGLVNFDSQGRLNTPRDASGNPTDGILSLDTGNFDSAIGGEDLSLQVDIGGFTQFSGGYNVLVAGQNGAEAGTLTGVSITREGLVVASFSNGQSLEIYQIPLADFVNPNGLLAVTGTVYAQTQDAGDLSILAAGSGGAGFIEASTVEQSNVDLADEFAHLIVSQRAFQANSRVVNTVDEMTQQLRQLKS